MALTSLDKDNLHRLFEMINIRDKDNITDVKTNYSTYSKLEIIAKQMMNLKVEAERIITNHNINAELKDIECNFKKVPGTFYYLYVINNKKVISLIANTEWNTYNEFLHKLYFDYDYQFYIV